VPPASARNTPDGVAEPRFHEVDMGRLRRAPDLGQEIDPSSSAARYPAAHPPIAAVLAERRSIAGVLVISGIDDRDLPDLVQIVVVAAWLAIEAGRYQPDPACPPAASLRAWLLGIAWRQATHHRERASQRYERPFANPLGMLQRQAGPDAYRRLDARDALRALAVLPERYVDILAAVALGHEIADYASENGLPEATAWSRLRRARAELKQYLAGRGWRKP
jgi:DNA-directed RNA polymerase specialized sigma24 family protein